MKEDHANFMSAFGFFLGGRDNRRALALLDAMEWYWYRSGRYAEGCSAIDAALALAGTASAPPELVGSALRSRAWLALLHGDWTGSEQAYRRSSEILRETQDRAGLARSLSGLGLVERWLGKEAEGFSHCRQGLAEARSTSDPRQIALALIWLYANTGGRKVDEAHQAGLEEILVLARKADDPWCEAHAFQGLGDYLRENGDIGTSILCYEESLSRFEALGEELMKAWTLEGLGMAKIKAGESEAALARLRDSCSIFMRLGDRGDVGYLIGEIGLASIASGRTDLGLTLLGASFGILRGMTLESGPAPCASAQASLGAPVPSRLATHFDEAKRRDPSLWTKGLYLSLDQAIDLALDRTNA